LSSISGIGGSPALAAMNPAVVKNAAPATTPSVKRDADGDFDGTQVGQMDPKDFGKGSKIDLMA